MHLISLKTFEKMGRSKEQTEFACSIAILPSQQIIPSLIFQESPAPGITAKWNQPANQPQSRRP